MTHHRTPRLAAGAALAAIALVLALGCERFGGTKIGDILRNPREYDGKTVVVHGEVKESTNILIVKYYVVKDRTGEIAVVTDGAVPNTGQKVRVKGVVNQEFAIGGKSLLVIRETTSRRD